jgi:hypothetical protein
MAIGSPTTPLAMLPRGFTYRDPIDRILQNCWPQGRRHLKLLKSRIVDPSAAGGQQNAGR